MRPNAPPLQAALLPLANCFVLHHVVAHDYRQGRNMRNPIVFLLMCVCAGCGSSSAGQLRDSSNSPPESRNPDTGATVDTRIDAVVIHPPVAVRFMCSEHPLGQEDHAGDALGQDCTVVRKTGGPHGHFPAFYSGDGGRNTDWFSWNEPLLAPFDGVVKAVHINSVTNEPGVRGSGMASVILFEAMGAGAAPVVQVGYVHVQDVQVQVGDTVKAGQVVARIGNNGISDHPHVHIGAVHGDVLKLMSGAGNPDDVRALQIRFDLAAMGRLRGYLGPEAKQ